MLVPRDLSVQHPRSTPVPSASSTHTFTDRDKHHRRGSTGFCRQTTLRYGSSEARRPCANPLSENPQKLGPLEFLSTLIPRPACLTWPGNTDAKKPLPYLPQEIQDQIFGYAVSATYEISESRSASPSRTTQAILMSSRRNNDEGLKSLYVNSVFRYTIAVIDETTDFMPALIDHMMNIELVVDCHRLPGMEINDELEATKLRLTQLVEMFGGTHIKRKTFRYNLCSLDWFGASNNVARCLRPLWGLQGFDTVRIEFDVVGRQLTSERLENLIKRIYDPTLGPATVGDGEANRFFVFGTRYVEFHPNGYRATKTLTE